MGRETSNPAEPMRRTPRAGCGTAAASSSSQLRLLLLLLLLIVGSMRDRSQHDDSSATHPTLRPDYKHLTFRT